VPYHTAKAFSVTLSNANYAGEVDTNACFDASTFPISPEDLIERTKYIFSPEIGVGTKDDGACLADDFEFCAAVVGPIGKEDYLAALKSFSLEESFNTRQNFFGYNVDPLQPNRVWFFTRAVATQIAPFLGTQPEDAKGDLVMPPQLFHADFNEDGLVKEVGFYTVDRRQGNTGGLGGAFGYFYGVGKPLPIPECRPFKPSLRFRLLNFVGNLGKRLGKTKK